MTDILQDTQLLPYVPQHASDDVDTRSARPRYSAKAALEATIRLRQHIIVRRGVEPGLHRADEGGE